MTHDPIEQIAAELIEQTTDAIATTLQLKPSQRPGLALVLRMLVQEAAGSGSQGEGSRFQAALEPLPDSAALRQQRGQSDRSQPIEQAPGDRPEPMRRDVARLLDNLYGLHFRPGHLDALLEVIQLHAPVKVPIGGLQGLITAKYLNLGCAEKGCQFLQREAGQQDAESDLIAATDELVRRGHRPLRAEAQPEQAAIALLKDIYDNSGLAGLPDGAVWCERILNVVAPVVPPTANDIAWAQREAQPEQEKP